MAYNFNSVKAKFRYANWFEVGRRQVRSQIPLRYLVRSWSQTGSKLVRPCLRPASNQLA